jgi:osmoprotectant transport system ATP-binding protein
MSSAVEFRGVTVITPLGRRILEDISLSVDSGSIMVLLGRSGSGKTTLLRTVNRMVQPSSGDVLVGGESTHKADLIGLRRGIGYVIQETGLFPHFTVERNVGIVLEAEGSTRAERLQRSHELLVAVGLDPATFAQRYPHQLSGGQRQRVGLARALAADPGVLLMDEPFGALDPLTRGEMQNMLRALLAGLKKTVLLVTHDLNEALYLGDRIALLGEGRLIASLRPREFQTSNLAEVQAYVAAFYRGEEAVKR